eukprot:53247-Eustigmatos_ZCMA.PRE.1
MLMYGKAGSLKHRQKVRRQGKEKREISEERTTETHHNQYRRAQPSLWQHDVEQLATMIEGADDRSAQKGRCDARRK